MAYSRSGSGKIKNKPGIFLLYWKARKLKKLSDHITRTWGLFKKGYMANDAMIWASVSVITSMDWDTWTHQIYLKS